MLSLELTADGFFKEMDTKFRRLILSSTVFHYRSGERSRSLAEKVIEAQAAAQRAANVLAREQMVSGRVISEVDARRCSCCGICVAVCPFAADTSMKKQSSGSKRDTLSGLRRCVTACPNSAAKLRSLKDKQVFSMIEAAF